MKHPVNGEEIGGWTPDLKLWLHEQALQAGFVTVGIAGVDTEDSTCAAHDIDAQRFAAWVEAGHAGEMEYLKRRDEDGILFRSGVQVAIPWARSVIVCAINYNAAAPRSVDAPTLRYRLDRSLRMERRTPENAHRKTSKDRGLIPTDYHDQLLLDCDIETAVNRRLACETRCYVDTGPCGALVAANAGIGWIGKNTCVINQGLGSWLLLGVIVTSLPVESGGPLDVAAIVAEAAPAASMPVRLMRSSRRARWTPPAASPISRSRRRAHSRKNCANRWDVRSSAAISVRTSAHGTVARSFGKRRYARAATDGESTAGLARRPGRGRFKRWFKGSPVERTRRKRLQRNVAIAMGNSGERRFLTQLETWATAEDPVLADAAQWAIRRIRNLEARQVEAAVRS